MTTATESVVSVPLTDIVPGDNDRIQFKAEDISELAASIEAHGLAQPVTLRPFGSGYQIVAGERRFRAFKLLSEKSPEFCHIPAIIRTLSDEQADAIMLAENVHRRDLNPVEEAEAYQKRMKKYGWSVAETARQCRVSEGRVRDRLKLLNLFPDLQHLARHGHVPVGRAQKLGGLSKNYQLVALKALEAKKGLMGEDEFTLMVSSLQGKQQQKSLFDLPELMTQDGEGLLKGLTHRSRRQEAVSVKIDGKLLYLSCTLEDGEELIIDEDLLRQAVRVARGRLL